MRTFAIACPVPSRCALCRWRKVLLPGLYGPASSLPDWLGRSSPTGEPAGTLSVSHLAAVGAASQIRLEPTACSSPRAVAQHATPAMLSPCPTSWILVGDSSRQVGVHDPSNCPCSGTTGRMVRKLCLGSATTKGLGPWQPEDSAVVWPRQLLQESLASAWRHGSAWGKSGQ
jgi:hypothetical protein